MRHLLAGLGLVTLARLCGLSQGEGAVFGALAIPAYEVYQISTNSGVAEWKDVGTGLVGVALVSLVPDRKPKRAADELVDLNIARIRKAIAAECDSVRTGKKVLPDSIWIHRYACAR